MVIIILGKILRKNGLISPKLGTFFSQNEHANFEEKTPIFGKKGRFFSQYFVQCSAMMKEFCCKKYHNI